MAKKEIKKHIPFNSIVLVLYFNSKEELEKCLNDTNFQQQQGAITNTALLYGGKVKIEKRL